MSLRDTLDLLRGRMKPPEYDSALAAAWTSHWRAKALLEEAEMHIEDLEKLSVKLAALRPTEPPTDPRATERPGDPIAQAFDELPPGGGTP